jgi:hypothetical protein
MTKWYATEHALDRVAERFKVAREGALQWIRQQMETAMYVTNAPDSQGSLRRVFVNSRVVLYASLSEDMVYSVIRPQKRTVWNDTFRKIAEKEIRKFNAAAIAEERTLLAARNEIEFSILTARSALLSTRSDKRKTVLEAELTELTAKLAVIEREINAKRRSVVSMAESFFSAV